MRIVSAHFTCEWDGRYWVSGRVRVLPADVSFEVGDGETVYGAACRQGLRWPSICHGDAECGICWMVVQEGEDSLSERTKQEIDRLALGMKAKEPRARLACCTRVSGEAVVERRGVRKVA